MVVRDAHILGHESSGVVIRVHPSVTSLAPGDAVAIEPNIPCLHCTPCLTGRYNGCTSVRFLSTPPVPGLLRRYLTHPAVWCHKLAPPIAPSPGPVDAADDAPAPPRTLTFEEGALLEPLAVALAGTQRAGVALGDPVLVCGAGPIGLLVALCCAAAGATPLVLTDVDARRLAFARRLVPRARTHLVAADGDASAERFAADVAALMGGDEPALAMECTGVEASVAGAVQAVRFGGKVFVIGVGRDHIAIPFMRLSTREVDLQFQYRYANQWPRAIRLVRSGVIDVSGLTTHRFGIEDAVRAFQTSRDAATTGAVKVIIQSED